MKTILTILTLTVLSYSSTLFIKITVPEPTYIRTYAENTPNWITTLCKDTITLQIYSTKYAHTQTSITLGKDATDIYKIIEKYDYMIWHHTRYYKNNWITEDSIQKITDMESLGITQLIWSDLYNQYDTIWVIPKNSTSMEVSSPAKSNYNTTPIYYDITGKRIKNPVIRGVYIIKEGIHTRKFIKH
jgi:hypothetical protein